MYIDRPEILQNILPSKNGQEDIIVAVVVSVLT